MARRLAVGGEQIDPYEIRLLFSDDEIEAQKSRLIIQKLLGQLIHKEPSLTTKSTQTWFGSYFFPFESCLIHHEATDQVFNDSKKDGEPSK